MRRALLVFNPEATRVSSRARDVITHALSAEVKLDVAETKRRHHATHLARGAAHEGYDLVVCFGGDGTLNEIINGLAGTGVPLVPIPGGGTNVFARTLGLPKDPIEATSIVIEKLHDQKAPHSITLGTVNGRYFSFAAGAGFDAQVVQAVERGARLRKQVGEWSFVTHAVRLALASQLKRGPMRVAASGRTIERAHVVVVCNSRPFTFLGNKPFDVCPQADIDKGLDAVTVRTLKVPALLTIVFGAFGSGRHLKSRKVDYFHDVPELRVESDHPVPYQVDGDYAGDGTTFTFASVPNALEVIA